MIKFVLLLFLLAGCAEAPKKGLYGVSEKDKIYFDRYEQEKLKRLKADEYFYPTYFLISDHLPETTPGMCILISQDYYGETVEIRKIFVSRKFWEKETDVTKEMVIFHELGHCDLEREHSHNTFSLMYPNLILSDINYLRFKDTIINELFTGSF